MSVAAIVPAFDEEKTVGSVVSVLKRARYRRSHRRERRFDGPHGRRGRAAGARVIRLRQNVGKAAR